MAAYYDWDDQDHWPDDSKCIVCQTHLDKSQTLICSATCEDIFELRGRENDCYA